jgi:hypothetical protein
MDTLLSMKVFRQVVESDSNAFAHKVTVEIEKTARPPLVAQWLCLCLLARVPIRSTAAHATAFRKTDK